MNTGNSMMGEWRNNKKATLCPVCNQCDYTKKLIHEFYFLLYNKFGENVMRWTDDVLWKENLMDIIWKVCPEQLKKHWNTGT